MWLPSLAWGDSGFEKITNAKQLSEIFKGAEIVADQLCFRSGYLISPELLSPADTVEKAIEPDRQSFGVSISAWLYVLCWLLTQLLDSVEEHPSITLSVYVPGA